MRMRIQSSGVYSVYTIVVNVHVQETPSFLIVSISAVCQYPLDNNNQQNLNQLPISS